MKDNSNTNLLAYTLRIADNSLILGQRLGEWCGHGPVLEQDMAMTNIALDLIGQSRNLYQYAAQLADDGRTEDDLAFLRDGFDFKNLLLVERPNGDFACTIVRQFLFSAFQLPFYQHLGQSSDETLRNIVAKSAKEVAYHLRWAGEWVIRLGDGTEESHRRIQNALDELWTYSGEALMPDALDEWAVAAGVGVDLTRIKPIFEQTVAETLSEATLLIPSNSYMQRGGKQGNHSEHLGYLLAEMQFMQRAYPNANW